MGPTIGNLRAALRVRLITIADESTWPQTFDQLIAFVLSHKRSAIYDVSQATLAN